MIDRSGSLVRELRTPRAAGIAGILFSLLLAAAVLLIQWALPPDGNSSEWLTQDSRRRAVAVAIGLIPYAGIAFLWFIGVIRARLGELEDRFFATAFLGSGLLFVAMLFTAAAVTGALLDIYGRTEQVTSADARLTSAIVSTGIVPPWLVVVGYATGLVLLFAPPMTLWATLLFPLWVLLLSVKHTGALAGHRPGLTARPAGRKPGWLRSI